MRLGCASAFILILLSSGIGAQELRRIAPERFPEMRVETQPTARIPPARPILVLANPLTACRPTGQRTLCLQSLATQSVIRLNGLLQEIEARWTASGDLTEFQKSAWARALKEADRRFRSMREEECGLLALSEPHGESELYTARLVCEIHRNIERIQSLSRRYAVGLEKPS